MHANELTRDAIAELLVQRAELAVQDPFPSGFFNRPPRPAAVLLPLFRKHNHWRLLFIRRAHNLRDHHSGEVAYPGGRLEATDAGADAAALREAREEIGLAAEAVNLLGRLPDYRTASNFQVTPVIAEIPWPLFLRADPAEVSRIFSMPLHWLADPNHHRVNHRAIGDSGWTQPVIYFKPFRGELLWGMSARVTLSLLRVLGLIAGE